MKKVVSKIVLGAFILGGMVYFNNIQAKSELSDLVLKNLTVLNTANAQTEGGGTSEKGPAELIDCAGWGTGDRTVCKATNTIDCTPAACK
jgi:hypothetical protein